MKKYEIHRLEKGDWSKIPALEMTEKYFDTPDTTATARIAYDDEGIFVKLRTDEKEHRCEETGPFGSPCDDSCLEFFFSPMEEDGRYFNIEFNSNLCMYLGMATSLPNLIRLVPEFETELFSPKATRDDKGWELEYKIPVAFVKRFFPDFEIYEGKKIRANCYKCSEKMTPCHFLSWSRVKTEKFTFHQRDCFGEMIFVK